MSERTVNRLALISMHTSPLDQPGTGDSGGMNVEIREVARRLGGRGIDVDIFTRRAADEMPEVQSVGPRARVVQIGAGPTAEVEKAELEALAPSFSDGVARASLRLGPYDLVHSHYWLSALPGLAVANWWRVPLVVSFHTLGAVKNLALGGGNSSEPFSRIAGERRAIASADRVVSPTREDARQLIELYGAEPGRISVLPPGVEPETFFPRDRLTARARLGLPHGPVVLFVGRLQPLKAPDLALGAFAEAVRRGPETMRDAQLLVVGGPSGPSRRGARSRLEEVSSLEGVSGRVRFLGPRPHRDLPWLYAAADVLLMPSHSESFGLAALEAQACGVPVVASAVGGLRSAVRDGVGGYLVEPGDAEAFARRLLDVLTSPELAARLSAGAIAHSSGFTWTGAVDRLLDVYGDLVPAPVSQRAS